MAIPPQEVITSCGGIVKVSAVIVFQVLNVQAAIVRVRHDSEAASQIAQPTVRAVLGQARLGDLLGSRDTIHATRQAMVDSWPTMYS